MLKGLAAVPVAFVLFTAAGSAFAQPAQWPSEARCRLTANGVPAAYARCGTLAVPLDPAAPDGPTIEIFVARIAALSAERLSEFDPDIVIQATPVGGLAAPDERLVPEWRPRPGTIAVDFVYRPRRTRWLEDAAAAGARTIDGRQLFLEQAAEQFAIFTGCEVERSRLLEFLAGS